MTKEAAVIIAFLRSRLICPSRANQGRCPRGPVAKSFPAKPMALRSNPNQLYVSAVPPPLEGRFAIISDVGGGMRWTQALLLTRALAADGEVVWSWRLDAGVKSAEAIPPTTETIKPISGESRFAKARIRRHRRRCSGNQSGRCDPRSIPVRQGLA
jgi:hypothetical protein